MIFQIIACCILITFYSCYFIKMIIQRKKGIKTDQLGCNKTGIVKFIEIALKIVTYIILIIEIIAIVINNNMPIWVKVIGSVMGSSGVIVFIFSITEMRDNWRAGVSKTEKTKLVTTGIYKISRNPAFLGFDLMYIGILLMFYSWWLFLITIIAVLMLHLQIINVEEPFLIDTFGDDYIEYKYKVNRYLGGKTK